MTNNKKVVIPNITYADKSSQLGSSVCLTAEVLAKAMGQLQSSSVQSPLYPNQHYPKQTNLEKAKKALSNRNNPKLSNLEKAKRALNWKVEFQSTPSGNPLYFPKDFYKDMDFKVVVNSGRRTGKSRLMEELIKYVMLNGNVPKNYDKNTNQSGNS